MEDQLEQVTALARLHYTPQVIAIILNLDPTDVQLWMDDRQSAFYKAYWTGFYEVDIQLRNSIFKLAVAGSGPAQNLAKSIQDENEARRYYHE